MKNPLTWIQLDSQCRKLCGNITDTDIYPATRQSYINTKGSKIYALLDGLNDPWYNRSTVLSPAADQEELLDSALGGGTITAIDSAAKTITRSAGLFVAGSIVTVNLWVRANGNMYRQWVGRIVTGGAVGTYEVLSGADGTLSETYYAGVIVIKTLSTTVLDISGIYVKDFLTIYDDKFTATPGQIRVFDLLKDSNRFFQRSLDIDAITRIAAYHAGDTVTLYIPSTAIAIGTVTAHYRGKPGLYTNATANNSIDYPPEVNQILVDEVVASFLIELGKPIPADVAGRIQFFDNRFKTAAADMAAALEKRNK